MKIVMKSRYFLLLIMVVSMFMISCGPSYDEQKRISRAEQAKRQKEDSLALKIGVLPTLDCLPIYVAKEYALFDTAKADIRLKYFKKQIDCDEALKKGRLEGAVTDIVRAERMKDKGIALDYLTATNAYWQLISNRKARIKTLKQLDDKMVAMTRFSATALLADYAVDSVKLKNENVFRIQINDVTLRLQMLLNNEMDALLLTEPQATTARLYKNPVLMDSNKKDMYFGLIAFKTNSMKDNRRKQQLEVFAKGYNSACDSINKHGLKHYANIISKYCNTDEKTINALPKIKFKRIISPRQKDIDTARKWLGKQ